MSEEQTPQAEPKSDLASDSQAPSMDMLVGPRAFHQTVGFVDVDAAMTAIMERELTSEEKEFVCDMASEFNDIGNAGVMVEPNNQHLLYALRAADNQDYLNSLEVCVGRLDERAIVSVSQMDAMWRFIIDRQNEFMTEIAKKIPSLGRLSMQLVDVRRNYDGNIIQVTWCGKHEKLPVTVMLTSVKKESTTPEYQALFGT